MTDIRRPALRYTADITVEDIDGLAGFIERRVVLLREAAARPGGEEELVGAALTHTVTALTGSAREVLGTLAGHAAEAAGGTSGPDRADDADGENREVTAFEEEFEELMARLSRLWRYLLTAAEAWSHLPDYDVVRWRLDGHLDAEHEARARWSEAGQAW
ncbi:hypothetical protein ADK60_11825 [Streptomyces sp. XY431]|uniref:hypothetical protein n=1 Tax=Streptomyces sp. XY431 TaxID=1415562 RepID=UPI0006AE870D|nr:hypothetical protein [Streptomyces sp. XY431]KOV34107.1 hypothetical protein ADK60_11825 [Streptomyces sp. XY431]